MSIITTPSGFEAEILLPEGFAEGDGSPKGLHYIGEDARARIQEVLLQNTAIFDVTDIAEDLRLYGFGYVDGDIADGEMALSTLSHLFPVSRVVDDVPNCLWHADKLRLNILSKIQSIMQPSAITLLHAADLPADTPKETGFGSPAFVAHAYNDFYGDPPLVENTAASLREFGEGMAAAAMRTPEMLQGIRMLLEHVEQRSQAALKQAGKPGTYWLPHKVGRTMLFQNDIVHANDLLKRDTSGTPRAHVLCRRMVPGEPFASFNEGIGPGKYRKQRATS